MQHSSLKVFGRLFLPLFLELIALRWLFRFWGLQLGWTRVTDYDFIVPLPLAALLAIFLLQQARPISLSFSFRRLTIHLVTLVCFVGLSYAFPFFRNFSWLNSLWILSLFTVIVSHLAIQLSLAELLQNPNYPVILPCALLVFTGPVANTLFETYWPSLAHATAKFARNIFDPYHFIRIELSELSGTRIILRAPDFALSIGRMCGGFDVFWIFYEVTILGLAMYVRSVRPLRLLPFILGGTIFCFILNLLRISTLFVLGIFLSKHFGYEVAVNWTMLFFHVHLGWLLYAIGLGAYFMLLFPKLLSTPKQNQAAVPA